MYYNQSVILIPAVQRQELFPAGEARMYELDYSKMGARICQIRKLKGLSQDTLAKRCGISLSFMGNIERGTKKMSMDTFVTMCRELETDADGLLWGVTKPSEDTIKSMWSHPKQEAEGNYLMYIQIMKSVADIMGSGKGYEKQKEPADKEGTA